MNSEYWKSSFILDSVIYYLVEASRNKAVFQIGNSDLYKCYAWDEVMGVITVHRQVSWQQASKFMK